MKYTTTVARSLLIFIFMIAGMLSAQGQRAPGDETFKVRALYVDCRTQVMTLPAIKALALDVSQKGINTLLMEYEATFPFRKHATLCNESAYTEAEVRELVAYCSRLGIDVIPLQNCFGHSEYILRHDRYANLREDNKEVSQVCPLKIKDAKAIFREIFEEVARLHPSPYFHIGADETYLLGDCKYCSEVAAKEGKSRLFVDYIKAMSEVVVEMGKTPIIWADIILMHPEAVHELPKELIFVDWNYGWEPDRFGKLENLFATGAEVWGAPSLRSGPDNVYLTQWEKHFNNLTVFVPFAREKGYKGMIQTSWSTSGTYGFHYDTHWEVINMQPIRSVYPMSGFNLLIDAYCAAIQTPEPLNGKQFATGYAQRQYGLTPAEAAVFWEYLTHPQDVLTKKGTDVHGTPVATLLSNGIQLRGKFGKLIPRQNQKEFEHYKLMLDLRINYLAYKEIESIYQSDSYERSQATALIRKLKPLITEADLLDKRFIELNSGYLKENQSEYINHIRSEKMKSMYQWLKANQQEGVSAADQVIIPKPLKQVLMDKGSFRITDNTGIYVATNELNRCAQLFSSQAEAILGYALKVNRGGQKKNQINLSIQKKLAPEEYTLDISAQGILLAGGSAQGVFHGLQSLRQLLMAYAVRYETATDLPSIRVEDKPFFSYRGSMLDICRHFSSVEEIKTYLDILSLHKINTFHFHLTDDQGWRIEIKKYPLLTEVGAVREGTVIGHYSDHTPPKLDRKPYGGYYTQEDIREIVAYASERFIEVIPEIEMPGHAGAALAAYPWLGCKGEGYKVYPYWGINSDVFCAGKDSTFEFLQDVLAEVIELFPSRYIHIGGDECPKQEWAVCPACQQRIKDNNIANEHMLQVYFTQRIEKWLKERGKWIIGWQEILEDGLSKEAIVMSWKNSTGGIEAAKRGNMAIMAPKDHCYFDYYQGPKTTEPLAIGGYVPVENVYKFDPFDQLNEKERQHILGVQANLWREYIPTMKHVEYMILPRLAALAEVGWSYDRKDYPSFVERMYNLPRLYELCGFNYAHHIFEE